ncbi:hypothetical protein [Ammoniphilus sp. CFH 90114]|uniref:hypothetical protein n=1 Tax=Ammoniphilus sp. CFH 90114 TaxID=2493665 RepID=UPI00100F29E2|nr:hypothetical protein [Ammoniphilus sp. CFH 90114]RXT05716.1 hypothetical protein EIZ39_16535 [Ammoniphilus sp. CFH 90114]
MDFYCPPCLKIVNQQKLKCNKLATHFISLKGKRIWRIRYLNRYAYQYITECQYEELVRDQPLILANATYWDDFNPHDYTGLDAKGSRSSIFA